MKVFLLADVERVGMSGEIITVSDGYAHNFLLPRKLAIQVTFANEHSFDSRKRSVEKRLEVIDSKSSMLAERIKGTKLVLKCKVHDGDRLYGAIGSADLAQLLADQGIAVAKNQIIIDKAIKKIGVYSVTVKLSSRLQPALSLEVLAELS